MSSPNPPITPEVLPPAPTTTVDDLYSQLAKANALVANSALQQAAVNSANLLTIATGAMMAKVVMAPLSADAMAMLRQMQQGQAPTDPFGSAANPIETDSGTV